MVHTDETRSLIKKYGGAVPRYTSFPTAVQFHDRYTHMDAQEDLKNISEAQDVSLYIHIPFCHSLCHYCGCHTKITHKITIISDYIQTLCQEIRLAGGTVKAPIKRIHFGGGSPNYAPIEDLQKILDTIRGVFGLEKNPDIDMECDPRLLDQSKIKDLIDLGVKRFSFGIQDFDQKVQKAIHRFQSFEKVQELVQALSRHQVKGFNFDLMTGLPEQTPETVQKTLDQVFMLNPSRIAVFPYAHVPWMKKHQKLLEAYRLPDAFERFALGVKVHEALLAHGYKEIGIDHYALPHDSLAQMPIRRNFQGYTDDHSRVILGLGLSAISQFEGSYAQNKTTMVYRQDIEAGRLPTGRGLKLSSKDQNLRQLIMTLMCDFKLDLRSYPSEFIPYIRLADLEQDGLIHIQEDTLRITPKGKPFTRVIAASFDPYLKIKEKQHAKAI